MNSKFLSALAYLIGVLDDAWSLFTSSMPAIAITILITLLIISIVIDRLLNPMIGKAVNGQIDTALYDTKKQLRQQKARNASDVRMASFINAIYKKGNKK